MLGINRRKFFQLSGGATAAALLAQCTQGRSLSVKADTALTQVSSHQGLLQFDLEAIAQSVTLGDRTADLLTYNGQVPGPRLEARPGDTVQIHFTNRLRQPTNVHYHGLHIPPTGTADNVFLEIAPGASHTYEFQIPPDHAAGTFWYHPHYHGLVAEQLFGGLAGLFVVRGALDAIPEIQAAQEEFLVLKDFALDSSGQIPDPDYSASMLGRRGDLLTVNGQFNPTLILAQGGLLRLRLLNASSSRFFWLTLEGHPLQLIATDGGAIGSPVALQDLMLAPGERAEVLVQGNRPPGTYRLLNHPVNLAPGGFGGMIGGGMMGGGMMGGGSGSYPAQTNPETIATLTYQGSVQPQPLPTRLITVDPLPPPQTERQFTLTHAMGRGMGMDMVFLINGRPFDHHRIDTRVTLNSVEDWQIRNTGMIPHPFHLHVNPFQVISRNGQPPAFPAWRDVVVVNPGEQVRIRIPFRDFAGQTVYHCHILDHEDRGMMGILEIQSA